MGKAFVCDCCGTYYKPYSLVHKFSDHVAVSVVVENTILRQSYDMCRGCLKDALVKLVKEASNE